MTINYDSPTEIANFLKDHNIWLKKRFGQNFLINPGAREKIINLLRLSGKEKVWEIGPGIGSLTAGILAGVEELTVFEIDHGLVRILKELFDDRGNLTIIEGDVIDTWKNIYDRTGTPDRIIGNLPYSSGSAIIGAFIEGNIVPPRMVFTVQKEQAERMMASPGSKAYSSFSVLCSSAFHIEQGGDIKPGSFFPRPEVMSRIVVLTPNPDLHLESRDIFFHLIRDLFHNKRKTLKNNLETGSLVSILGSDVVFSAFRECNIPLGVRAETLSAEIIAACADVIEKLTK